MNVVVGRIYGHIAYTREALKMMVIQAPAAGSKYFQVRLVHSTLSFFHVGDEGSITKDELVSLCIMEQADGL